MIRLTIELDPAVLERLEGQRTLKVAVAPANGTTRRADPANPKPGSLPARLRTYAEQMAPDTFGAHQIMEDLDLSRAHASMLLSRCAESGIVERVSRGQYRAPAAGGEG